MSKMLEKIKKTSSGGKLVVCFVGVGGMLAETLDHTSIIVAKNGVTMLVDMGANIRKTLLTQGIRLTDFDYYFISHSHSDHDGAVQEFLISSRYAEEPRKPNFIITASYQDILWDRTLRGGLEYNEAGLLRFSDYANPIRPKWVQEQPREMYRHHIKDADLDIIIFRTAHIPGMVSLWENAFWSTGLMLDKKVVLTCDTRYTPELFEDLDMEKVVAIFHDCQTAGPGIVHASYTELKGVDDKYQRKMYLTHYGDNWKELDAKADGFKGFAQPWTIYKF